MSSKHSKCFFCCNYLPIDSTNVTNSLKTDNPETFQSTKTNCSNNEHRTASLFQMFHYLNIPKDLIDKYNLSSITICHKCREISENLSKLCGELEETKLKIAYALNLLTDQILFDHSDQSNEDDQLNLSNIQEIFRVNCLSKLSASNHNPQLILKKCQTPRPPDNLPEQSQMFENLESDYSEAYIPEYQQANEDFPVEKLIAPGQINHPPRKLYDRSSRRCEYCDKMIGYTNLSSHKRMVHGIIPTAYRPNKPFCHSKLKKQVNCEFCGRNVSYRNLSTHNKYYCAVLLNKNKGKRKVRVNLNEIDKFVDKPENIRKLLQTCGHCGQVVLKEGFKDHEQLWCPITKGKVGNMFENDGMSFEHGNQNMKVENEEKEWPVNLQINY